MLEGSPEFQWDERALETLRTRLVQQAHARYRVSHVDAEDIVQTTFAAYLQVRHRYVDAEDQGAILYGIFRKKCAEHIDRSVREQRRLARYLSTPDAARENAWIRPDAPGETPAAVDDILRTETRRRILEAISELRPTSRELVALIVGRDMRRHEMIRRLDLNKNTFDSRLHACRAELRALLRRKGLGDWKPRAEPLRRSRRRSGRSLITLQSDTGLAGSGAT